MGGAREPGAIARGPTPEDLYAGHELARAVRQAVDDLPQGCREIFLLRRRDHLSYEEIVSRTRLSLGTVKSQMWHAVVHLKMKLAFILDG